MRSKKVVWLVKMALLTALSLVLMYLVRFPIFPAAAYLEYDMADVPILIGTFMYGPAAGLLLTGVVSLLQWLLVWKRRPQRAAENQEKQALPLPWTGETPDILLGMQTETGERRPPKGKHEASPACERVAISYPCPRGLLSKPFWRLSCRRAGHRDKRTGSCRFPLAC